MINSRKMEEIIGLILFFGTCISAVLVFIGGILYLWQNGSANMQTELLSSDHYSLYVQQMWYIATAPTALGIVELGLLALVFTQIFRVGLLLLFYTATKDYWFSFFSGFIFFLLIYSFFWHK